MIINQEEQGVLGVGAFSQVRKVIDCKIRAIRAMKVISKSRLSTAELQQKFINEINVYKQFDHPHILKLYEFIRTIIQLLDCVQAAKYLIRLQRKEAFLRKKLVTL